MDKKPDIKKTIRSSLFRDIFTVGKNFIDLYKECSGKILKEDDLAPFDLNSEVLRRPLHNDVSHLLTDNRLIILTEHLSSPFANAAVRDFLYYSNLAQLWLELENINISRSRKVHIPLPEFYIAYNGSKPFNKNYLTFGNDFLYVNIKLVDINFDSLTDKAPSNTLAGYSYFINNLAIAKKEQGCTDKEAFTYAVEQCKKYGYLQGIVDKEDFIMYQFDIGKQLWPTEEELIEDAMFEGKKEGMKEGMKQGMKQGRLETLVRQVHRKMQKHLTRQQIINELELDEEDIEILDNFENYKYLLDGGP